MNMEKNWNIALDNNLVNEIKVLLKKEDLKKGIQLLQDFNLWCLEQITTNRIASCSPGNKLEEFGDSKQKKKPQDGSKS